MSDFNSVVQGIPEPLKGIPERPFGAKGVVLNVPPQLLVEGAVLDAKNYIATEVGLKRRPGTGPFTSANVISDPPIQDAIGFWKATGTQDLLVLGQDYLYKASTSTGYTLVRDQWEVGGRATTTGADSIVTGVKTKFQAAGVATGDYVILDADGSAGGPYVHLIVTVDSETQLTVVGTPVAGTGVDFKISRLFKARNPWFVDSTIVTGATPKVLFADGAYPIRSYDGTTLQDYGVISNGTVGITSGAASVTGVGTTFVDSGVVAGDLIVFDVNGSVVTPEVLVVLSVASNTSLTTTGNAAATHTAQDYEILPIGRPKPHCVVYHKDRVWTANTVEAGVNLRQRIRWTATADLDNFTLGGYLDLPYVQGAIKKLVPMGDFLLAYFDDALFIGRPASSGNNPFVFQQIETGNIGLLGMKAVTRYLNSHAFIGQDDIYLVSVEGIKRIGSPVVRRTIQGMSTSKHWMCQVATDQINERILFGFPKAADELEELWSYSYKSQAWAHDDITCQCLSCNSYVSALTWGTFVTAPYSTGKATGVSGDATLTGVGTTWSAGVCAAGDSILIDIDADGNYEFVTTVASRTSNTELEMDDVAPSTFGGAGVNYRIVKASATWSGTEMAAYPTWDSFGSLSTTMKDVYLGKQDNLWKYDSAANTDDGTAITNIIVTKDYDYDVPDTRKFFGYLGLKLESWNDSVNDLVWTVEGSTDRGQYWKPLGPNGTSGYLKIKPNTDEGAITFRMVGSIIRFRLTSISIVNPYIITEAVLRARQVGRDVAARGDV